MGLIKKITLLLTTALLIPCLAWSAQPPPHSVRAFRVGVPLRSAELTGLGSVRCFKSAKLGFAERGVLAQLSVEEGDQVKKGQILARLDDRVLKAQIKTQQAKLESALLAVKHSSDELDEAEKAYKVRALVLSEVKKARHKKEQALSELKLSRAELAGLRAKLKNTILFAPLAGTVVERLAEPGEVVGPQSEKVLTLMSCGKVLAEVSFGEKLYTKVSTGQPVLLTADALPRRDFIGKVYAKSPQIDDKDRTFKLKVLVDNSRGELRPGMFVRALLLSSGPLWIPEQAILARVEDRAVVQVVKDRKVSKRRIDLGPSQKGMVRVLRGLRPGDLILLGPPAGQSAPPAKVKPKTETKP